MTRLNQIIAVEMGVKDDATKAVTAAKRLLGAEEAAFYGLTRTYEPRAEAEAGVRVETRPDERVKVQVVAEDVLTALQAPLARLFDITLTKETADAQAKADVVVPGAKGEAVLLTDVPVTYLMFLEKQVTRLRDVIAALPVVDPAVDWYADDSSGLLKTERTAKTSSKKVPRNHVKWEPPDHTWTQPAQVDVWQEDVIVGDWFTVRFSGAVTGTRKRELLERCDTLLRAVLTARGEANSITVTDRSGKVVLDWLLA